MPVRVEGFDPRAPNAVGVEETYGYDWYEIEVQESTGVVALAMGYESGGVDHTVLFPEGFVVEAEATDGVDE